MPAGRPTSYKEEYCEQVRKLCLLGATDIEMSDFFGICEKTFNNWKREYPEFLQSIKEGKISADSNVGDRLFQRACGYSHPDTHFSNYQGEVTETPMIKHYAPDTAAAIFWMKNRRPDLWRDKQEVSQEVKAEHKIEGSLEVKASDKLSELINGIAERSGKAS